MRGHIRKYKGRWAGIVELEPELLSDGTKKRKQKWVYGDTKKEVEVKVNEIVNQLNKNEFFDASTENYSTYLTKWLNDYAKHNLSPRTYDTYEQIVNNHIKKSSLGKYTFDKLKPAHIQTYYTNKMNGGLSASTVLYHHKVIHISLKHAVKWQYIRHNPADAVEPPSPNKPEHTIWDSETIGVIIEASKNTSMYIPIILAATTGMRRSEICGLQWEDIDLDRGLIYIRHARHWLNGESILTTTKTDKSNRPVVIDDIVVEELKSYKAYLESKSDYKVENNKYVCTWEDGRPLSPSFISQKFAKIIRDVNKYREEKIPQIRFHDLRHSHATELLKHGINPKIVSERLGHSKIQMTLDIYSHVLPDMQKEAAKISTQNIFKKDKEKS